MLVIAALLGYGAAMFPSSGPQPERHLILIQPEVPWNTGNIGRTCLGAGARLHLVRPLGFSIDDRQVKRAGLDYWPRVKLKIWDHFSALVDALQPQKDELALFSAKGRRPLWCLPKPRRLFLVFGSETRGLPRSLLAAYAERVFVIPISADIRCLNLSSAAAIALYESLRPPTAGQPPLSPQSPASQSGGRT